MGMKVRRQSANKPTPLRWLQALIFTVFAGLALQVTAAGENQQSTANKTTVSEQPGQQDESKNTASGDQDEVMEEVIVIGQKQIFTLRHQIILAEDHAFEMFNILNDDDEYDVHCRMVANLGTRIKRRTCLPNFYYTASADRAQEFMALLGVTTYVPVTPSVRNVFAYKFPIFKEKVKKLAEENPDFLDALHRLFELNDELKKTRDAYHGFDEK